MGGEGEGGTVEGEGEGETGGGEVVSAGTCVVVISAPVVPGTTVLLSGCDDVIGGRGEGGRGVDVLLETGGDMTAVGIVADEVGRATEG